VSPDFAALSVAIALVAGLAVLPGSVAPVDRTAVVDQFEGERVVLVLDDRPETVAVERSTLPPAGRHVDAVFRVRLAHGNVTGARYDREATRRRACEARERFDRLSGPPADDGSDPGARRPDRRRHDRPSNASSDGVAPPAGSAGAGGTADDPNAERSDG